MQRRDRPGYRLLFLLVVAPAGAFVLITALLLFGVRPGLVFSPGFAVRSLLEAAGVRAPNAVGVVSTGLVWWAAIACAGLAWDLRRRRRPG